jgi:hypothetical protein
VLLSYVICVIDCTSDVCNRLYKGVLVIVMVPSFPSAVIPDSEILTLSQEEMGEVSNSLCQGKGVPPKNKTDFRSFCLATMMWVHHLGPTSIKEFKVSKLLTYFIRVQTQIYFMSCEMED